MIYLSNSYRGCEINAFDSENQTPLMLAVMNGHKDTVEVLLENDADMRIVDLYEKSVIYCAAEENAAEVLKVSFLSISFSQNQSLRNCHLNVSIVN